MSRLLGTRAGVKSVKFWQLSSCWLTFRWWLFRRVFPLWAQLEDRSRAGGAAGRGRNPALRRGHLRLQALIIRHFLLDGNSQPLHQDQPQ